MREQQSLPISVAVITLNEERDLPRCLESVHGLASEIVVIDSGSTDETAEVARSFGARFESVPWRGHIGQKNAALERCSNPWVLCLDADEALSPGLAASIRKLFANGDPVEDGFWVNRRTFYLGGWIWHAWYPEWRLRFVRKGVARWGGLNPHDKLQVGGATARLDGDLLHYSYENLEDHFRKATNYARISAESYQRDGRQFRWYYLVFSPWWAFFKRLILKQAWRDGWRGWIISFVHMANVSAKYAFLWEKQRSNPGAVAAAPDRVQERLAPLRPWSVNIGAASEAQPVPRERQP